VFGFKLIAGQELPHKILTAILKKGKIPHALLFLGIEGIGKTTAAITFAMAANCTAGNQGSATGGQKRALEIDRNINTSSTDTIPCGTCKQCKKILSENHADILHIRPSGSQIKISQIRSLAQTLSLKPYEAKLRTIIIYNAQYLNPSAGNALLKLLEEPPDRTVFILTAPQSSDMLPTIISRCQPIRFRPIPAPELLKILNKEHQTPSEEAYRIATMAGGSLSKALAMKQSKWINIRTWMLNELESLSLRPTGALLAFAEKLSKNKETLLLSMEIILYWLRDLIIFKYNPEKIINNDFTDKIQYISKKNEQADILTMIKDAETIQKKVLTNINIRLTMEIFIMRLAKIKTA